MNKAERIQKMLNKHRGKFGAVQFEKTDGSIRTMNFRQAVKNGVSPLKGGNFANTSNISPKD